MDIPRNTRQNNEDSMKSFRSRIARKCWKTISTKNHRETSGSINSPDLLIVPLESNSTSNKSDLKDIRILAFKESDKVSRKSKHTSQLEAMHNFEKYDSHRKAYETIGWGDNYATRPLKQHRLQRLDEHHKLVSEDITNNWKTLTDSQKRKYQKDYQKYQELSTYANRAYKRAIDNSTGKLQNYKGEKDYKDAIEKMMLIERKLDFAKMLKQANDMLNTQKKLEKKYEQYEKHIIEQFDKNDDHTLKTKNSIENIKIIKKNIDKLRHLLENLNKCICGLKGLEDKNLGNINIEANFDTNTFHNYIEQVDDAFIDYNEINYRFTTINIKVREMSIPLPLIDK